MRDVVKYSEAFKLQVVGEVENGRHESCYAAGQFYGIGGTTTVQRWVREYGKNHLIGKVVKVEKPGERSELKKLQKRVAKLEKALADTTIDLHLEKAYTKLACKAGGIEDIAAFKKKHDGARLMTLQKKVKD